MSRTNRNRLDIVGDEGKTFEDRRMFLRFPMSGSEVRFKDLKQGEKGVGLSVDIGGGGVGMRCRHEMRARTPLELWIDLPDGFDPLHLLGKVSWTHLAGDEWDIGVAFSRQKLLSLSRIMKLVEERE